MKLVALVVALAAAGAAAEQVQCPFPLEAGSPGPGEACRSVLSALSDVVPESLTGRAPGLTPQVVEQETSDLNGDLQMDTATAEFKFVYSADGGNFFFSFGLCRVDRIDASVRATVQNTALSQAARESARLEFAKACVGNDRNNSFLIFDDIADDPGVVETLVMDTPVTVVFYLIPNTTVGEFAANADAIYAENSGMRRPLFSLNTANYDDVDQFILYDASYTDGSSGANRPLSLFMWEDKDRSSLFADSDDRSDHDFADLVFELNAIVTPTAIGNPSYFCDPAVGMADDVCLQGTSASSDTKTVSISFGPGGPTRC